MKPPRILCPLWSRSLSISISIPHTRNITTQPATFANIKYELLARPPRIYHDYLTPTNSHLLSISLPPQLRDGGDDTKPINLPHGHHLVYFPPTHPTDSLLPDGTDTDHWPGPPFVRRMWASGSVSFRDVNTDGRPVRDSGGGGGLILDGRRAVCVERIEDVRITGLPPGDRARTGNTPGHGEKIFVDVVRRYGSIPGGGGDGDGDNGGVESVEANPAIVEKRTLVFLTAKTAEEARLDAEKPMRVVRAPTYTPTYTLSLRPQPSLLFRFSALSFNAHAIHLDRQHCREVEGYRNLLVHGPLLLTLMLSALTRAHQASLPLEHHAATTIIKGIEYRNLAPVFVGEDMTICVRGSGGEAAGGRWDVWVVGPEGGLCVKGSALVDQR